MFMRAAKWYQTQKLVNLGSLFVLRAGSDNNPATEQQWRDHAGRAVLVATKQTCGVGLTFTEANNVIITSPAWNSMCCSTNKQVLTH